jgi:hypothetical protein
MPPLPAADAYVRDLARLSPKSATFTRPRSSIKIFGLFKSKWRMGGAREWR